MILRKGKGDASGNIMLEEILCMVNYQYFLLLLWLHRL